MKYLICAIICLILSFVSTKKKYLNNGAIIAAWILAFAITFLSDIKALIILILFFLLGSIAGVIKSKIIKKKNISEKRNALQVIANSVIAVIALVLYKYLDNEIYLIIYASVIAASLADSLASELGVLSNKQPIDVLTLKPTRRGLSGAITLWGVFVSFLGSAFVAILFVLLYGISLKTFIIITVSGFTSSIIDSIIGSLWQVKYKCVICKKITEKRKHCDIKTDYLRGITFIDNNVVNLMNNIFAFLIAYLLMVL